MKIIINGNKQSLIKDVNEIEIELDSGKFLLLTPLFNDLSIECDYDSIINSSRISSSELVVS